MKKILALLLCVILLCASLLCPGAAAKTQSGAARTAAAGGGAEASVFLSTLETFLDTVSLYFTTFFSQLFSPAEWFRLSGTDFPKAAVRAEELLLLDVPTDGSALPLATLQGLLALQSPRNLFFRSGAYAEILPNTGATLIPAQTDGSPWDFPSLLKEFSGFTDGYILCDDGSASVGISLARQLNSIVVPEALEGVAREAGLPRTLDVRGKDDAWLRRTSRFYRLNRDVAVEQTPSLLPRLADYAVMCGAYYGYSDGADELSHKNKYRFLNNGALVLGWNPALGEYKTVASLSSLNACLVPADHAFNLSVLSGYAVAETSQRTRDDAAAPAKAHTVCLLMSDGDNLQWLLNSYTDGAHFGSAIRGEFPFGWGVPACAADLAAPMLQNLYDKMTPADEFVLSLSGCGYTFPSRWTNLTALERMAGTLAEKMTATDTSALLVLDDGGFNSPALNVIARESGAAGIFYIDYDNYAGMEGAARFVGDVPVVAARYRLWAGTPGGSPAEIAAAINDSPTDPQDPASYSFVIVHAWSGLGADGDFAESGDTMAAVKALVGTLDEDTLLVTPARFLELIRRTR